MSKKKKEETPRRESTVSDVASALRKEAMKQNKKPAFRIYKGWQFGFSFNLEPAITREMWDTHKESVLARFGINDEKLANATYEDFLAARRALEGVKLPREWIFSACLHPRSRSSTQEDWTFLGRMVEAVGAPRDSLRTPLETTNPNDVHYWTWLEDEPRPLGNVQESKPS